MRARTCRLVGAEAQPHSGRDLAIRHLVHGLDADDAVAERFMAKTGFELDLRLARAEDQDQVRMPNARDDLGVVLVEVAEEPPVPLVLGGVLLGPAEYRTCFSMSEVTCLVPSSSPVMVTITALR